VIVKNRKRRNETDEHWNLSDSVKERGDEFFTAVRREFLAQLPGRFVQCACGRHENTELLDFSLQYTVHRTAVACAMCRSEIGGATQRHHYSRAYKCFPKPPEGAFTLVALSVSTLRGESRWKFRACAMSWQDYSLVKPWRQYHHARFWSDHTQQERSEGVTYVNSYASGMLDNSHIADLWL